jgi:hypothetical protein
VAADHFQLSGVMRRIAEYLAAHNPDRVRLGSKTGESVPLQHFGAVRTAGTDLTLAQVKDKAILPPPVYHAAANDPRD